MKRHPAAPFPEKAFQLLGTAVTQIAAADITKDCAPRVSEGIATLVPPDRISAEVRLELISQRLFAAARRGSVHAKQRPRGRWPPCATATSELVGRVLAGFEQRLTGVFTPRRLRRLVVRVTRFTLTARSGRRERRELEVPYLPAHLTGNRREPANRNCRRWPRLPINPRLCTPSGPHPGALSRIAMDTTPVCSHEQNDDRRAGPLGRDGRQDQWARDECANPTRRRLSDSSGSHWERPGHHRPV